MSNSSQRSSHSDDDSWGKIASDLFGIQFNEDDDFELPDDDSPAAKPQPVDPVVPAPVKALAETPDVVSDVEIPEEPAKPAKGTSDGNQDNDEFWDILESWNWDETSKTPASSKRSDDSRGSRSRPEPEARRPQREETPGRTTA